MSKSIGIHSWDSTLCPASCFTFSLRLINCPLLDLRYLWLGKLCLDISKKDRNSTKTDLTSHLLQLTSVSLRNTQHPSFSNRVAFPFPAYFSQIVAIFCMISTDRQHQLVYSISSLKQVRFITTEQDLSLATRFSFMLSSLEPIKCMPFSRRSVPKFGTLFLIRLKYWNVRPFVKK